MKGGRRRQQDRCVDQACCFFITHEVILELCYSYRVVVAAAGEAAAGSKGDSAAADAAAASAADGSGMDDDVYALNAKSSSPSRATAPCDVMVRKRSLLKMERQFDTVFFFYPF